MDSVCLCGHVWDTWSILPNGWGGWFRGVLGWNSIRWTCTHGWCYALWGGVGCVGIAQIVPCATNANQVYNQSNLAQNRTRKSHVNKCTFEAFAKAVSRARGLSEAVILVEKSKPEPVSWKLSNPMARSEGIPLVITPVTGQRKVCCASTRAFTRESTFVFSRVILQTSLLVLDVLEFGRCFEYLPWHIPLPKGSTFMTFSPIFLQLTLRIGCRNRRNEQNASGTRIKSVGFGIRLFAPKPWGPKNIHRCIVVSGHI